MVIVQKLRYLTKELSILDLISKGVIDSEQNYRPGTHAVVHLPPISLQDAVLDQEGNIISLPIMSEYHHVDIMVNEHIDFGEKEILPNNPKHGFF